jgi:S-adenosylmethionine hydrolase
VRPVALLTDFGLADHYVGVLHAVLEREAPGVRRIDLGHQVPPGDVWTACFLLRCAWPSLPGDAVVLAVVDPGVGRRSAAGGGSAGPMAGRAGQRSRCVGRRRGRAIESTGADGAAAPSATFHGHDLFAPAAARLARGRSGTLGERVSPAGLEPCPIPDRPPADDVYATVHATASAT